MPLAIVTDSTCDLPAGELERLEVHRVPLYVSFRGATYRAWSDFHPADIVAGVEEGADLPTTSQPSPKDFENAYREAVDGGADQVLCITITSELSGTFQSANLATEEVDAPVTVFDSRAASIGLGDMVRKAAEMRAAGADLEAIMGALEHIRDTNYLMFSPATLEYLQKGGRIGRAQALMGSLLNVRPILSLRDGSIEPVGRVRGNKKLLKELVANLKSYAAEATRPLRVSFVHIQDPEAARSLKEAVDEAGIEYTSGGYYEMGAVIATHVGPGTYGYYAHTDPG